MYTLKFLALVKKFFQEFLPTYCAILTKFRNDWVKIVDFLVKAYFWVCSDLGATPGM